MPRFSLEVTSAVKREEGWEVTALATVLYGNRAPDPPEEVVFDVNGEEFERTQTNPESGIARSVMIFQSGGYIVTAIRPRAGANDRDARRTRTFSVREEKKEREPTPDEKRAAEIKSQTELVKAERELEMAKQEEIPKPKRPTRDEKKLVQVRTKIELAEAKQKLRKFMPFEPRPRPSVVPASLVKERLRTQPDPTTSNSFEQGRAFVKQLFRARR